MTPRSFIAPILLLGLWWAAYVAELASPLLVPNPRSVGAAALSMLVTDGSIWADFGATLRRVAVSLTISCAIGVPLGLTMGLSPMVRSTTEATVDFFRSIPPIVLFPVFILVLGVGEATNVAVPTYGCLLVMTVSSLYGVTQVTPLRRSLGDLYGFSRSRTFFSLVLPEALPRIALGLRTSLSLALVLSIVVEMLLGNSGGLGTAIYDYHLVFKIPEMYAAIILTGLMGFLLNIAFVFIEYRVLHWSGRAE